MKTINQVVRMTGTAAERATLVDKDVDDNTILEFTETDTGDKYEWDGDSWTQTSSNGATRVADVGVPSQRRNRLTDAIITATWPGNDTFSVTWTQAENVRRYRILVTGGADGDYVKVCEDAVNEAQAESWLTTAVSTSTDLEHFRVYTSTPDANGSFIPLWSEWQELSKDQNDLSLSRLDFLASAAGPFTVFVEAE